jgi:uncharacterized membrane protein
MIVIAIFGGMVYPYQAVKQFYLNEKDKNIESLDGSKWMLTADVGDLETIKYINKNLKVRSVIAEAAGDSYTNYARISTFTGQIAPVGWQTHEWTWRFEGKNAKNILPGEQVETGWGKVSKVAGDIQKLYETNNLDEVKKIIENYNIEYVYVGKLEREKYLNIFEEKFNQIGELVFKSGENRLYRVKKN